MLIGTSEAAKLLLTTDRCVRQWIARGDLSATKEGRLLKLERHDVLLFGLASKRKRRKDVGTTREGT